MATRRRVALALAATLALLRRPGLGWVGPTGRAGRQRLARVARGDGATATGFAWTCVKNCGACCYLAPEDRPYLADLLTEEQMETFRGLVQEDGWCRHFDKEQRNCQIYDDRPIFCRVKTWLTTQAEGFQVDASDPEALAQFCGDCCREHVTDVYGENSPEMGRFVAENPLRPAFVESSLQVPEGWEERSWEDAADRQPTGAEAEDEEDSEEDADEDASNPTGTDDGLAEEDEEEDGAEEEERE